MWAYGGFDAVNTELNGTPTRPRPLDYAHFYWSLANLIGHISKTHIM